MSNTNSKPNAKPNPQNPSPQDPAPAIPPVNDPPATPPAAPALTQADIDRAVTEARQLFEKEKSDAEALAKLSEDERKDAEIERLKNENQAIKAKNDVVAALKLAGAKEPELLYAAKKESLIYKDGKATNIDQIVADLKLQYSGQFGEEKPNEPIDGGAGNKQEPQGRAENFGDALKNFYNKKTK